MESVLAPKESVFVTKDQAAELVGISRKQFDRAARKIGLKAFQLTTRNSVGVRFTRAAVLDAKKELIACTGYPAKIASPSRLPRVRQPKLPGD